MNICLICGLNLTSNKSRKICKICNKKKHEIKCLECDKICNFTPNYYLKLDSNNFKCKQCKLKGDGNPNFNNKWSEERKKNFSLFIKLKVDDEYRKKCSKGMKGKKVSEETKLKRKNTLLLKYGKLSFTEKISEETKLKIGEKSKLKFNEEYLIRVRKVNEERGVWIPLEKKDEYIFYRELSNWIYQVLTEKTIGVDKLKNNRLYDKNNRDKDSLVRDHMYGRKNGFLNEVFPEIIRHPANCQLISHSENIKKSKKKNDSIINLDELFVRIKKWNIPYKEQDICIDLIKRYENGERYNKNDYINNIYK
jgi:hypothetical protein